LSRRRFPWHALLAALPALVSAAFAFGPLAVVAALGTASLAGWLVDRLRGGMALRESLAGDLLVGTLVLLCVPGPPSIPLVCGASLAAAICTRLLARPGGAILLHPVALVRLALLLLVPSLMNLSSGVEVITGATPLGFWRVEEFLTFSAGAYSTDLILGLSSGAVAEGLGLPLAIGAVVLLVAGSAGWALPLAFVAATLLVTGAAWLADSASFASPAYHLLSGELFLGAFFLSPDPRTNESAGKRGLFLGIVGGAVHAALRLAGLVHLSVAVAVLIVNVLERVLPGSRAPSHDDRASKRSLRFRVAVVASGVALVVAVPLVVDEILAAQEGEDSADLEEGNAHKEKSAAITSASGPGRPVQWRMSEHAGALLTGSEVTVAQFAVCVRDGACSPSTFEIATGRSSAQESCNAGQRGRDEHPMNCVTWAGAQAFCSYADGRLPSSSEWLAEATAGGARRYPWGDEKPSCDRAVWGGGSKGDGCGEGRTFPVCSRPSGNSASGLCDMIGNVAEWVSDEWAPWTKTRESEQYHLARGGGWSFRDAGSHEPSSSVRLRHRFRGFGAIGFRCLKDVEASLPAK
jgi:Na+-translocating ferredoxin:NAD+ oxidoreductase RnfD subunit